MRIRLAEAGTKLETTRRIAHMDRDTFWESFRDIGILAIKLILVLVFVQIVMLASGSEMKLPVVYGYMMRVFYWWKETFGNLHYGM